ncbi:hypothetical protein [Streptomyces sp. NPDC048252]|uniref:hypothetical protein n=1 Tax=Streptomyces sp. NPDC048252 TaxID=3154612 RepID=UPI0034499482
MATDLMSGPADLPQAVEELLSAHRMVVPPAQGRVRREGGSDLRMPGLGGIRDVGHLRALAQDVHRLLNRRLLGGGGDLPPVGGDEHHRLSRRGPSRRRPVTGTAASRIRRTDY